MGRLIRKETARIERAGEETRDCIVSFSGLIISVGGERANTRYYEVSVRRGFFFRMVLRIGCDILLWHSMGLPYN